MRALAVLPFFVVGAINLVVAVRQLRTGELLARGPVVFVRRSHSPKLFWTLGLLWASFSLYVCVMTASIAIQLTEGRE